MDGEQKDPLRTIAEQIVNKRQGINDIVKNKMIDELIVAMERMINTELVSRLDDAQAQEFTDYLDQDPSDEDTLKFFKDRGVDVDQAVIVALKTFKDAYVG